MNIWYKGFSKAKEFEHVTGSNFSTFTSLWSCTEVLAGKQMNGREFTWLCEKSKYCCIDNNTYKNFQCFHTSVKFFLSPQCIAHTVFTKYF